MRRKATTSAGVRSGPRRLSVHLCLGGWLAALCFATGDAPPRKGHEPYALIAGTVFRQSGFVLPGAEITVTARPTDAAARKGKFKRATTVADGRGEFAVRVPVEPMRYLVTVRARGFRPQEKLVEIEGDQRVDLFFQLQPESH